MEPIRGFIEAKECGLLYWAATEWPVSGPVLELGAFEGRSTMIFVLGGRQIHAVDAWTLAVDDLSAYGGRNDSPEDAFERFKNNIRSAKADSQVSIHRGLTHTIGSRWHVSGAILFIDAGHTYQDVKGDLEIWTPHLLPGGLLLLHDVLGNSFPGVTRSASELLQEGWRVEASAGNIVAFTRRLASE